MWWCSLNGNGRFSWKVVNTVIRLSTHHFQFYRSPFSVGFILSLVGISNKREINEFDSCQFDLSLAEMKLYSIVFGPYRFWCANLWSFFYFKPQCISKGRWSPTKFSIGKQELPFDIKSLTIHIYIYIPIDLMLFYRIDPCSLFYVTHNYIFYDTQYPYRCYCRAPPSMAQCQQRGVRIVLL